jgi:serine-type D-Ala-D-Ala carboxypeptidase (penicillin-binding protein 5/6)
MLEYLLFALFSVSGQEMLSHAHSPELPQIEILNPQELPQLNAGKIAPKLLANEQTAVLAQDMNSKKILLSERENRAQPIASVTKIMTALVILSNHDLDEIVTVSKEATQIEGAQIGIYQHEKLTVETLLQAALIPSANDAAVALAVWDAGSEDDFAVKMNEKSSELGLKSAEFFNSTGLDMWNDKTESWYGNKMSARDVARMARFALQNEFFKETVAKRHFWGTSVGEEFFHEKKSTNKLFDTFLNLSGVKTGYTQLAGQCFVALGNTSDGHEVLTVVLGSMDRFGETKKLLSWVYDSFTWR